METELSLSKSLSLNPSKLPYISINPEGTIGQFFKKLSNTSLGAGGFNFNPLSSSLLLILLPQVIVIAIDQLAAAYIEKLTGSLIYIACL